MTAIIYLDNEPFYCFDFKRNPHERICEILIENAIRVIVDSQEISSNILNFSCSIIPLYYITYEQNEDEFDISHHYKKTPGRITPIWFENDCGKQITFLIE